MSSDGQSRPEDEQGAQQPAESNAREQSRSTHRQQRDGRPGSRLVTWFTETVLRTGLAAVGLVLLLVATGQIAGVDTFAVLADVFTTEVARWGAVAVFALLLIVAAGKRWGVTRR